MVHSSNAIARTVSHQKQLKRRLERSAIGLLLAMIAGSMGGCREEGRSVAIRIELLEARSIDHIVFYRGSSDDRKLYVMRPDGTGQTCVEKKRWADMYNPLRSPDGKKLARQGSRAWYIVSVEEAEVLPAGGYYVGQSRWSPDSRRFAFSDRAGIHVIDAGAGEIIQLTKNSTDRFPAWSPDGTRIVFERYRGLDNPEIYIMSADGSRQRNLTRNRAWDADPDWWTPSTLLKDHAH